jgi:hypothetical protein
MLQYQELNDEQKSKAIKMAHEDVVAFISEGFWEFKPNTEIGKKISSVVDYCKVNPRVTLIEELEYQCRKELFDFALVRAEDMLYHPEIFKYVE